MFFILLAFATVSMADKLQCSGTKEVHLTGNWSIPWTDVADYTGCWYFFYPPAGYFAVADVLALDMQLDPKPCSHVNGECSDFIFMQSYYGGTILAESSTFNSSLAWPAMFQIKMGSTVNTTMKLQIYITLQKNIVGQNMVRAITTDTNQVSTVLYSESLQEGQTYTITSKSSLVTLITAVDQPTDDQFNLWNDIFLYENGNLLGTLLAADGKYTSRSPQLQIYVAKTPVGLTNAAIVLTDRTNIVDLADYYAVFVPLKAVDHTASIQLKGDSTNAGAVTVVGKKDGSTPFDVRQMSSPSGSISYVTGGPSSSRTQLNPKSLPAHFTGNLNTFFVSSGQGSLKITLS